MALAAVEDDTPKSGHNSEKQSEITLEYFKNRVRIDAAREELNEQADANRQMARDMGLVTKALDKEYSYWKASDGDKEGYDDTVRITQEALNNADTGDLFAALIEAKANRAEKRKAASQG